MRAERRERRADRLFERLDLDRDGSITREEIDQARARARRATAPSAASGAGCAAIAAGRRRGGLGMRGHRLFGEQDFVTAEQFRERALARFDRADADHDGTLTAAERREARAQRRAARGRLTAPQRPNDRGGLRPSPPLVRLGAQTLFARRRFD